MKKSVIHLLFIMFQEEGQNDVGKYSDVDSFYGKLGYDFESESLLNELGVFGTSQLQELFLNYLSYLNGYIEEEEFDSIWNI